MRIAVSEEGLRIPKELLEGVTEFEVEKQNNQIVIRPIDESDPIYQFGKNPVKTELSDGAKNHDQYLYKPAP